MASLTINAQTLTATNDIVDCGQVMFQRPVTAEFELTNNSNHATTITKVETHCGCAVAKYDEGSISAKSKTTLKITYDATTMGHFDKVIEVFCDNEKLPLTLRLKGVVVREVLDYGGDYPFKIGMLMIDKNELEFDDVVNGDQPQQIIHIRNTGSEVAQPVLMHLPDYLTADVSPSKLSPGQAGIITVTLDSRQIDDLGLIQTKVYLGSRPGEKVSFDKEIAISTIVLENLDELTEEEKMNAPRIELSQRELHFDTTTGKNKQKQEILITNMGLSDLQISNLQMFTTGVALSLNKQSISPKEVAKLKVEINVEELKKLHSSPRILMITNDPNSPKVVIKITLD